MCVDENWPDCPTSGDQRPYWPTPLGNSVVIVDIHVLKKAVMPACRAALIGYRDEPQVLVRVGITPPLEINPL